MFKFVSFNRTEFVDFFIIFTCKSKSITVKLQLIYTLTRQCIAWMYRLDTTNFLTNHSLIGEGGPVGLLCEYWTLSTEMLIERFTHCSMFSFLFLSIWLSITKYFHYFSTFHHITWIALYFLGINSKGWMKAFNFAEINLSNRGIFKRQ